jgi:hypothetical protein
MFNPESLALALPAKFQPLLKLALKLSLALGLLLMIYGGVLGVFNPRKLFPKFTSEQTLQAYAHYFAIRNLTLAIGLLALFFLGARRTLGSLMAVVGVTQFFDAVVDLAQKRWGVALAVFGFAVLLFVAAAYLSRHPFWVRAAWVD